MNRTPDTPNTSDASAKASANNTATTKSRSKSEEKREAILTAAADLFIQQGFVNTSMDQIAKQAEVSKQTVYSHFGDKHGIFAASIEQKCIAHSLEAGFLQQDLPVEELLSDLSHRFAELVKSDDAISVARVCISNAEEYPDISNTFFEAGPERVMSIVIVFLEEQHRKGHLVIKNPTFAAYQLLHMLHGAASFKAQYGLLPNFDNQEQLDYIDDCVAMFLRAYKP
ncbi:HTH-type transcriptional regulator SrpR [BD1-7 clade bacterium]|uniref:HTH-type transcriptional regulator SrpR n=1 Tax=BD1-7 clade bacterium TaxID=2029982 RepID=A0A5S9NLU2_9GAMM|nr:HTH-type transcriptional regulator SrpR [BD1-7 clade bacterium]CAA0093497.1 HTH-type transcriptional regulator SrpR [BD1-7 clade bacterium]